MNALFSMPADAHKKIGDKIIDNVLNRQTIAMKVIKKRSINPTFKNWLRWK